MDPDTSQQPGLLQLGDLLRQDLAAFRIFVAQIEIDVRRLDKMGA